MNHCSYPLRAWSSGPRWALLVGLLVVARASLAQISPYCPNEATDSDERRASWNKSCAPSDASEGSRETLEMEHLDQARLGSFERVLAIPGGELDATTDRVAVEETNAMGPVAVWVLTERSQIRLPLPVFKQESCAPSLTHVVPRFDPKDGSLVLFGFGLTCNADSEWLWRWRERWVLEGQWIQGDEGGQQSEKRRSREPKGRFPEVLSSMVGDGDESKRVDGSGRYWYVGSRGAYVYEKAQWLRLKDAPPSLYSMMAQGTSKIWLSGAYGIYRVTLPSEATVVSATPRVAVVAAKGRAPAEAIGMPESALKGATVERVILPVKGERPLSSARRVVALPGGGVSFVEPSRIVVLRDGQVTAEHQSRPLDATSPLAYSNGNRWRLSANDLLEGEAGKADSPQVELFAPNAISVTGETGWATTCRSEDLNPIALRYHDHRWASFEGLPHACYRDVFVGSDGSAWMAGGVTLDRLSAASNGRPRQQRELWPTGEGLLVNVVAEKVTAYRVPTGALLCVTVSARGEVWAGGYDGLLIRRHEESEAVFRVQGDPWILALSSKGDKTAIAGEGLIGVIRGQHLYRVPPAQVPVGAWRSVAFDSTGSLWVVGDPGILKIQLPASLGEERRP